MTEPVPSKSTDVYVPDDAPVDKALRRTTHLGIGAHPDDLELMALDGILSCFQSDHQWFTGVTMTHGGGSPYASFSDEELRSIRRREQRKAASVGEYGAVLQLAYDSETVRTGSDSSPETDLQSILRKTQPDTVYTHTPADRHPTHVGVAMRVLQSLQALSPDRRPDAVYGCEVWRSLDWLPEKHRHVFEVTDHPNIAQALIEVFDSQISGGKRYDRAGRGRRRANATFNDSHASDQAPELIIGMNLTPAMSEDQDVTDLMETYLSSFHADVMDQVNTARSKNH